MLPQIALFKMRGPFEGTVMSDESGIKDRDLRTLVGVVKGPGFYPTPSPDRIKRMIENGLIKQEKGILRSTLKGRIVARLYGWGLFSTD
jgi:hypothetical protein